MVHRDSEDDYAFVTVGGNVVGGDFVHSNINIIGSAQPVDLDQIRADYLAYIRSEYGTLDVYGIGSSRHLLLEMPIESLYIPLYARIELPVDEALSRIGGFERVPDDVQELVLVEQALAANPRTVILGAPGSGKTTLLKIVALQLAREAGVQLPIIIPLRAYSESLLREDRNLQQYFSDHFAGIAQSISNLAPLFESVLSQGQAVVLLDGLDEVQSHHRPHVVKKIEAFAREAIAQGNRVTVTSRRVGYRESPLDPRHWSVYTLMDFDLPAIEQFLTRWFLEYELVSSGNKSQAEQVAAGQTRKLLRTLKVNPSLLQLARSPFLLTILVVLTSYSRFLPPNRVEWYESFLRLLIDTRNPSRTLDKRPVQQSLYYFQTVSILAKLALWLQEEHLDSQVVPESRIFEWLTDYYAGEEWKKPRGEAMQTANHFLDSIRENSGLLVEDGQGNYGFAHRALQEYLAARGLVESSSSDNLTIIKKYVRDPAWKEVILLAIATWAIVLKQTNTAAEVTHALLQMGDEGIFLANASLEEIGEERLGTAAATEIRAAIKAMN